MALQVKLLIFQSETDNHFPCFPGTQILMGWIQTHITAQDPTQRVVRWHCTFQRWKKMTAARHSSDADVLPQRNVHHLKGNMSERTSVTYLMMKTIICCRVYDYREGPGWKPLKVSLSPILLMVVIWGTSWENLFLPYANNKGADQPAHPRSLISAFVSHCPDSIIPKFSKSMELNYCK